MALSSGALLDESVPTSGTVIVGPQADTNDHELGGPDWRRSDDANQSPFIQIVLRHRRSIATHEVRFVGGVANESATAPLREQEVLDAPAYGGPEHFVIGFERDPLEALINGVFEEPEVAPHVHVFPFGVVAHGPGAP